MYRMLVVVFDNETKACEGKKALRQLDGEGSIVLYAFAVLVKNPDGTATVRQSDDSGPFANLVATALGSLIGLPGGPAGVAIGAAVGSVAGGSADLHNTRIAEDFVDYVAKVLLPNRVALVAEIKEDLTTPVDTRMEAIGGSVFRRDLSDVEHTIHDEHIAIIKADIAQVKAELATAHADRKANLQGKINQLQSRLKAFIQKAKERS